jgi:hypothetical protein
MPDATRWTAVSASATGSRCTSAVITSAPPDMRRAPWVLDAPGASRAVRAKHVSATSRIALSTAAALGIPVTASRLIVFDIGS